MSGRHAIRAALIALVLIAIHSCTASAAQVTLQPSPAEARTFSTTDGGWSSAVDYNGLVCIPGVTCPSATPSFQAANGSGGARDGFLRNGFGTLLGVLSTTTISWSSPSFVAPSGTDAATLAVSVRPQIASLLAIGTVRLDMRIIDVATPASSTLVASVPITTPSSSFGPVQVTVPPSAVGAGRTYRVQLDTALTTSVSAVTSGNVDLDDVVLRLSDLAQPTGLTATVPGSGAPRITGAVDPAGLETSVVAEYGLTAAYGSSTTPVAVNGSGSQPFTIPLAGLTPGATYHYRVIATNADGRAETLDATFVAPTPPSDSPPVVTGAGNNRNRTVTYDRGGDVVNADVELLDGGGAVIATVNDSDGDGSVAIVLPDADGAYGVRVVRENASRVTSTSATVPAVLDRVAPDVSGVAISVRPQVSRDTQRTVEFTAPRDVVAVSAQVIDGGGADVGAPVSATGGSAIVQLGAAEGDYRVRLTFQDAAGNAATALSGLATVDTTAPSSGGAPNVTGAGNSRDRDVAFDRDLTTLTATIEAVDRDGVVVATTGVLLGDSGSIRLPDADGDYTIRVRQTDAAGNSAATPPTAIVLDRVAPSPGPAPTVTGAGNARGRTVAFTRDGDTSVARIEVVDAGGLVVARADVPAGLARGTVTLPDLDGSYRVRVVQSDVNGNSATSPETAVTLDRVAPDPGPAPTVTGLERERQRGVTFARASDAASATIELLDVNGTVIDSVAVAAGGSGSITLPDADGGYAVRIRQTDAAGNSAMTGTTAIVLDRDGPTPGPAPTVTGAGSSRERTVSFTRAGDTVLATIEVLDSAGDVVAELTLPTGDGGVVTLPALDGDYRVRVRQQNREGTPSLTPETSVTLDTAAPDAGPAPSTSGAPDTLLVTFRRAPDAATATIEVLDSAGNVVLRVPVPSGDSATLDLPDAAGDYTIRVVQTDGSGNSATTPIATVTRTAGGGGGGGTGGGPGGGTGGTGGTGGGSGAIPITDPGGFGTVLGQCFGGDVVLTDVTVRGTIVTVAGLTRFAPGTAVTIVDLAGTSVGSAVTDAGGRFGAAVTAPRAARARLAGGYRAVVGSASSRVVKVRRANVLSAVTVRGTTITLRGRVDVTRLGTLRRVRAYGGAGAAACRGSTALRAIGRTLVNRRTGAYTMRVRAPAGSGKLVLRTRAYGSKLTSRSSFLVK